MRYSDALNAVLSSCPDRRARMAAGTSVRSPQAATEAACCPRSARPYFVLQPCRDCLALCHSQTMVKGAVRTDSALFVCPALLGCPVHPKGRR
jgi:hypothetical protein